MTLLGVECLVKFTKPYSPKVACGAEPAFIGGAVGKTGGGTLNPEPCTLDPDPCTLTPDP